MLVRMKEDVYSYLTRAGEPDVLWFKKGMFYQAVGPVDDDGDIAVWLEDKTDWYYVDAEKTEQVSEDYPEIISALRELRDASEKILFLVTDNKFTAQSWPEDIVVLEERIDQANTILKSMEII